MQLALHRVGEVHDHVVAQVVEAEFAVLAVRDVGQVRVPARHVAPVLVSPVHFLEGDARVVERALLVRDEADGHPERVVDRSHPARPGLGEVVVRGHEVRALPLERVQIEGERRHEGLPLAGLHLGDVAAMEPDTTQELDVEVGLLQRPRSSLADDGEGTGEDVLQRLAGGKPLAEQSRLAAQLFTGELRRVRLEGVHRFDDLAEPPDLGLVAVDEAEQLGERAQTGTAK